MGGDGKAGGVSRDPQSDDAWRAKLTERAKSLLATQPAEHHPAMVVDLMMLAVAAERRRIVQSINGVVSVHGPARVVELILSLEAKPADATAPREV